MCLQQILDRFSLSRSHSFIRLSHLQTQVVVSSSFLTIEHETCEDVEDSCREGESEWGGKLKVDRSKSKWMSGIFVEWSRIYRLDGWGGMMILNKNDGKSLHPWTHTHYIYTSFWYEKWEMLKSMTLDKSQIKWLCSSYWSSIVLPNITLEQQQNWRLRLSTHSEHIAQHTISHISRTYRILVC